jgi:hypothetical protein
MFMSITESATRESIRAGLCASAVDGQDKINPVSYNAVLLQATHKLPAAASAGTGRRRRLVRVVLIADSRAARTADGG